jgi:hypothetical protein
MLQRHVRQVPVFNINTYWVKTYWREQISSTTVAMAFLQPLTLNLQYTVRDCELDLSRDRDQKQALL